MAKPSQTWTPVVETCRSISLRSSMLAEVRDCPPRGTCVAATEGAGFVTFESREAILRRRSFYIFLSTLLVVCDTTEVDSQVMGKVCQKHIPPLRKSPKVSATHIVCSCFVGLPYPYSIMQGAVLAAG